jgi:arylsulfatase A-like enzyme
MDSPGTIATSAPPLPDDLASSDRRRTDRLPPGRILLLSIGIGLVAGYLDLGLLIARNRLNDRDFYHLGQDFVWIIPAGVTLLVLIPGTILALIAALPCRSVRPGIAVGVLTFLGLLDVGARLPLDLWASLVLAGGIAIRLARRDGPRLGRLLTLLRRTTPPLIGVVLATALVTAGGRAWSEHRAIAALPPPPASARNVLLIVWDTVRAANTSLHGYHRGTTPNLEKLAARGVRFDRAFATSSWTLPSHASLFTGRWPHELGVDWTTPMRTDVPTLAGYLGSLGYDTAGFVANLDHCSRESGLARGFARYEDYPMSPWDVLDRYVALGRRLEWRGWAHALDELLIKSFGRSPGLVPPAREHVKGAAAVDGSFLDWLTRQESRRRPFFAFLNFNDAHSPYEVPDLSTPGFGIRPSTASEFQALSNWSTRDEARLSPRDVQMTADVYDDCIAHLDRRLGVVLEELDRRGVLANTLVIVTSDHGEHLGDHGLFFHGCSLYRQLVQVPLVIASPGQVPAGRSVAEPVSLRDMPATVVDLLGLGQAAPFPGRSSRRFWDSTPDPGAGRSSPEPLLMETGKPIFLANQGREPAARGPMSALIDSGMHYIRLADGREELYLLDSDPQERVNMAGSPTAAWALPGLRKALAAMFKRR